MGLVDKVKEKVITKAKSAVVDTVKTKTENTVAALSLIVESFKNYLALFKYGFIAISVAMSVYNIIANTGKMIISIVMICNLVIYSVLDNIFKHKKLDNPNKRLKVTYAWIKLFLNALALSSTIYSLYASTALDKINPISIVLTTLSIILFVLKLLLEIIIEVMTSKWQILKTGLVLDGLIKADPEDNKLKESHVSLVKERLEKRRLKKEEQENESENVTEVE